MRASDIQLLENITNERFSWVPALSTTSASTKKVNPTPCMSAEYGLRFDPFIKVLVFMNRVNKALKVFKFLAEMLLSSSGQRSRVYEFQFGDQVPQNVRQGNDTLDKIIIVYNHQSVNLQAERECKVVVDWKVLHSLEVGVSQQWDQIWKKYRSYDRSKEWDTAAEEEGNSSRIRKHRKREQTERYKSLLIQQTNCKVAEISATSPVEDVCYNVA
ncbi:hypothetical protein CLF_108666 [Clonorchis sinensis]|uniref:Uncharacterized protein n=1 Tax=Clonorchis sinensis TaxID=79923 RepID=G7YRU3_CLOSI|nr:hypothetical protein CLF_108666 [Clonorchis sinensis]